MGKCGSAGDWYGTATDDTATGRNRLLDIYVDADGCPVRQEVYRVARRYELQVYLAANAWLRAPGDRLIELVVVKGHTDAADDWIADNVSRNDIVITADVPLAARCIERDARVLDPRGRIFDDDSIGDALASRELMSQLREMGTVTGGPKPFAQRDRSNFLQKLDETIQKIRRGK